MPNDYLHNPDRVSGPDDIHYSSFEHHMSVRKDIANLVREGSLEPEEADVIYQDWLEGRTD